MPPPPVILSVLDQSPIRDGGSPAQAINETIALAQAVERLGYHRYWVAEHHAAAGLAGTAPEILVARLAAGTQRAPHRLGRGHAQPLQPAQGGRDLPREQPQRGRAGAGRLCLDAGEGMIGRQGVVQEAQEIGDLAGEMLDAEGARPVLCWKRSSPAASISASAARRAATTSPPARCMGSSDQSAAYAAHFGCAFSFAHFITDQGGPQVMDGYRRLFQPSPWLAAPEGSIGVFVLCADTEAAAQRLARSRDLWRLRFDQGVLGPIPSIEEAEAYPYSREDRLRIAHHRRRQVIGAPEQVREKLLALGEAYGVGEFVIVSICYDFAARLRSYALLAEVCGLAPRAPATE